MSNWCYNSLTITGNHLFLSQFVSCAFGIPLHVEKVRPIRGANLEETNDEIKPYLSFHSTVPMPDAIQKSIDIKPLRLSSGELSIPPLYSWAYENWGCATDIYAEGLTPEGMGWNSECTKLSGGFGTAWTPPIAWVKKTAERFPHLTFKMFYHEYGHFFAGEVVAHGEKFTHTPWSVAQCEKFFFGE